MASLPPRRTLVTDVLSALILIAFVAASFVAVRKLPSATPDPDYPSMQIVMLAFQIALPATAAVLAAAVRRVEPGRRLPALIIGMLIASATCMATGLAAAYVTGHFELLAEPFPMLALTLLSTLYFVPPVVYVLLVPNGSALHVAAIAAMTSLFQGLSLVAAAATLLAAGIRAWVRWRLQQE